MIKSVFSNFTKLYSLPKSLRFELLPVGETRNKMSKNLQYDESLKTFLKDQEIEDAYQILKPVFDKIHEEFITKSLENDEAKKIDFSNYLTLKRNQEETEAEQKKLREEIVKLYEIAGNYFITEA
ncbi:MAG: hypothetical protein LBC61_04995 [Candidatus Peribacteria bacterium]|jgi:CRISPR-associated protein Cpf1|nr:hypothetical protein [Candidatus Peribacteria bacterium]